MTWPARDEFCWRCGSREHDACYEPAPPPDPGATEAGSRYDALDTLAEMTFDEGGEG